MNYTQGHHALFSNTFYLIGIIRRYKSYTSRLDVELPKDVNIKVFNNVAQDGSEGHVVGPSEGLRQSL